MQGYKIRKISGKQIKIIKNLMTALLLDIFLFFCSPPPCHNSIAFKAKAYRLYIL